MKFGKTIFLSLRFSLSMTIVAVIGGCALAEGIRLNVDPVGWCMANYDFYPPAERKVYCETTFLAERNQLRIYANSQPKQSEAKLDRKNPQSGTSSPSSTKTKFSIFDGLGVPSRSDCIQTEWISESVPTSNNLTDAYFSSKGPRDPTGRGTTTDRKLLVATNVCKERLRFYAAGCGDVTMSTSGNTRQEGSWSAGELAQVWPYVIGPFLVLPPGSRIVVAESHVNNGSPGTQELHPVQVAWGAWVNESVGTTNMNTTQAGKKLDRRAKAIHEELNRTVRNKPGLGNLGPSGGSTPRRFRAYMPGANSCKAVNIQAVWDATQ